MEQEKSDEDPGGNPNKRQSDTIIKIEGKPSKTGFEAKISSKIFSKKVDISYPKFVWDYYPETNKKNLLDNLTYIFTAHLPLLLNKNIELKYTTNYPMVFSWTNHCFMKFLPSYWYLHEKNSEARILPVLKRIINTEVSFEKEKRSQPKIQKPQKKNVLIPFTFGKDSMLTYFLSKEIGLKPTLVYFNEPTELFAKKHRLKLIKNFEKEKKEKIHFMENNLASLRSGGNGWFGWESTLTSYALLSLPFAYFSKATYIVFSNEIDCNYHFVGEENCKVRYDFEQSSQATEEMSHLTQNLGGTKCTNFLMGLHDLGIFSVLKNYYRKNLKYLMSCWAETSDAKNNRWCENCSKCARTFLFLSASGIDPIKETGFKSNLFEKKYEGLFNLFGEMKTAKFTFESTGTSRNEQLLAFYLCYLRKNKSPLVEKFTKSPLFKEAKSRFPELLKEYYSLHEISDTPQELKNKIDKIFNSALKKSLTEIRNLK